LKTASETCIRWRLARNCVVVRGKEHSRRKALAAMLVGREGREGARKRAGRRAREQ
jgi:hypothetical protein